MNRNTKKTCLKLDSVLIGTLCFIPFVILVHFADSFYPTNADKMSNYDDDVDDDDDAEILCSV